MRPTRLTFPGATGTRLAARLERPADGTVRAYALFAHCFTCSKDLKAAVHIGRELTRHGIAVLRFDFTGLGESEGDFADTNFSSNVDDLIAACEFLSAEYTAPTILIGHSLGGAAVLQAAGRLPSVRAVATIGAPFDPQHVRHLFEAHEADIRATGEALVTIGGRRFSVRSQFLDDLEASRSERAIAELRRALLVMHSPVDRIVGIENAAEIYRSAKHPKSFVSLDTADHLLGSERDARYAAAVLAAWVDRYVDPPVVRSPDQLRAGSTVVARIGPEGYRTEIRAGGHGLVADEPEAVGGTGMGPDPYGLLAASLGACTAMTLRLYADRKRWPLEGIEVHLAHRRVHAEDEAACEDRAARMDELDRVIYFDGDLEEGQRDRLMQIADRCPIHQTLNAGVRIVTRAAPARTEDV